MKIAVNKKNGRFFISRSGTGDHQSITLFEHRDPTLVKRIFNIFKFTQRTAHVDGMDLPNSIAQMKNIISMLVNRLYTGFDHTDSDEIDKIIEIVPKLKTVAIRALKDGISVSVSARTSELNQSLSEIGFMASPSVTYIRPNDTSLSDIDVKSLRVDLQKYMRYKGIANKKEYRDILRLNQRGKLIIQHNGDYTFSYKYVNIKAIGESALKDIINDMNKTFDELISEYIIAIDSIYFDQVNDQNARTLILNMINDNVYSKNKD